MEVQVNITERQVSLIERQEQQVEVQIPIVNSVIVTTSEKQEEQVLVSPIASVQIEKTTPPQIQANVSGIVPLGTFFVYGTLEAEYSDDTEYNDIIRATLPVTNNTLYPQICTVNFKLGNYIIQVQQTIAANSTAVFECTFENIDIFQENVVTVFNSANQLIDSVTIPAYPEFEMFFEAITGSMTAKYSFSALSQCDINWGDGTSDEIAVTGGYNQYSSTFEHTYSTAGLKRITFSNSRSIVVFRVNVTDGSTAPQYYISDISQLRNIVYIQLYSSNSFQNIIVSKASFRKATKKLDVMYFGTSIPVDDTCFSSLVYSIFYIRYAYNFNLSADKLSEIMLYSRLFQIYSASINSDSWVNRNLNINSLIIAPYINSTFYLIYCNLVNIDRNSDFGNGSVYNFQFCNLTSEAVDNAIYVVRNTNNYTGTGVKTLNLSSNSRRTHASDADLAILLSRGWVVTVSGPL